MSERQNSVPLFVLVTKLFILMSVNWGEPGSPLTAALLLASVSVILDRGKDKEGALTPELVISKGVVVMEDVVALEVVVVEDFIHAGVVPPTTTN